MASWPSTGKGSAGLKPPRNNATTLTEFECKRMAISSFSRSPSFTCFSAPDNLTASHSDNEGNAVWASNTAEPTGDSSVEVVVQDDGNVVLYKRTAIWCSETHK